MAWTQHGLCQPIFCQCPCEAVSARPYGICQSPAQSARDLHKLSLICRSPHEIFEHFQTYLWAPCGWALIWADTGGLGRFPADAVHIQILLPIGSHINIYNIWIWISINTNTSSPGPCHQPPYACVTTLIQGQTSSTCLDKVGTFTPIPQYVSRIDTCLSLTSTFEIPVQFNNIFL